MTTSDLIWFLIGFAACVAFCMAITWTDVARARCSGWCARDNLAGAVDPWGRNCRCAPPIKPPAGIGP